MAADFRYAPKKLWAAHERQCLLVRSDGRYELHLLFDDRVTRLETCVDEAEGYNKAARWLIALNATFPE